MKTVSVTNHNSQNAIQPVGAIASIDSTSAGDWIFFHSGGKSESELSFCLKGSPPNMLVMPWDRGYDAPWVEALATLQGKSVLRVAGARAFPSSVRQFRTDGTIPDGALLIDSDQNRYLSFHDEVGQRFVDLSTGVVQPKPENFGWFAKWRLSLGGGEECWFTAILADEA